MTHEHHSSGEDIVIHKVTPRERGRLEIASSAIGPDGRIGDIYSAYHDNISPPLEWTRVLDAESFALVVEDPDAPRETPFVHWMIWNIPGDRTSLPQGLPHDPVLKELGGAVQGLNSVNRHGYFGPRPPAGHGVHRYHFQLFALGKTLGMGPETTLKDLLNALKANTLTSGEIVGTYLTPDPADAGTGETDEACDHTGQSVFPKQRRCCAANEVLNRCGRYSSRRSDSIG